MSLRYADFRHCERCAKGTPHDARGRCVLCRSGQKRAARRAKLSNLGQPLARHNDLRKIADALWSVWVRAAHDRCEMCGAQLPPEQLQNAHGISREDRAVRYDEDNQFALDSGCHRSQTPPKGDWDLIVERMLTARGQDGSAAWAAVKRRSRSYKLTSDAVQLLIINARQRIEGLPEGQRKTWALERAAKTLERHVTLGVRSDPLARAHVEAVIEDAGRDFDKEASR